MILLQVWWDSLQVFHYNNLKYFLNKFFLHYLRSTKIFLKYFFGLFFVDVFLFLLSTSYCNETLKFLKNPIKNLSFCSLIFYLFLSLNWFLLSGAYLLSIRLRVKSTNWHYFKINLIRYFQLYFTFSLFAILFFNFMIFIGISNFPRLHWTFQLLIRIVELLTIFYWLDLKLKMRKIFVVIEKAINFFMYNFPFFLFVTLLGFFLNYSIKYLFLFINFNFKLDPTLGTWKQIQLLLQTSQNLNFLLNIKFLIVKYVKFFANNFILSFIFTFYTMRKNKLYMNSFFELEG